MAKVSPLSRLKVAAVSLTFAGLTATATAQETPPVTPASVDAAVTNEAGHLSPPSMPKPTPQAAAALPILAAGKPVDPLVRSASAYGAFHTDVSVHRNRMQSAEDLDAALAALGGQNADQLAQGWLAYSALVAASSREYQATVREMDAYLGRRDTLLGLKHDKAYWRRLDGGSRAITLAIEASDADARRLRSAGEQIKTQSYDLQKQGWAKRKLRDATEFASRLEIDSLSARPMNSTMMNLFSGTEAQNALRQAGRSNAPSLWDSVTNTASQVRLPSINVPSVSLGLRQKRVGRDYENSANHIAALAAYHVLGESTNQQSDVSLALNEPVISSCVQMAQLEMRGCVAANHFRYERPFCTGEYLNKISECIDGLGQ